MVEGLGVLAVVPARGGSKGIPLKNLRLVGDRSLVAHVACVVREIISIDAAILSTDDVQIAEEGERHGLEVPFMRPAQLSDDDAGSMEVWRHAWLQTEAIHGRTYDVSVLLEPTSPLRRASDVERTIQALLESDADCAFTVSRTQAHYTPQKTLLINSNGFTEFYLPVSQVETTRQRIPPYFHRNGICYAVRRHQLIECGQIVGNRSLPVVIDRPVVNIDEPFELELADWLYRRQCSSG